MEKKENEDNLQYIERILAALMALHEVQGVVLAIKTRSGNGIITSKGNPPYIKIVDCDEWEEMWGE